MRKTLLWAIFLALGASGCYLYFKATIPVAVHFGAYTHVPTPKPAVPVFKHVAPDYLYPNPTLTPGKADTLNVDDLTRTYDGQTYSQAHRNVSITEKKQVYQEYGISYPQPYGTYEVDHFYPECGGGNNGLSNLWLEPAVSEWNGRDFGFHAKDKLEAEICRRMKAHTLDPQVAFQKLTTDWVAYYLELFP